jgi:low affinity Fe/Cu permease
MKEAFRKLAKKVTDWTGTAGAFGLAVLAVAVWGVTGPFFHYSENWQLVINTGTTIVTFLMVFLIQNMQNRDSQIIHLKLDELIRTKRNARNELIDLDERTDEDLIRLHQEFLSLKEAAEKDIERIAQTRKNRSK